MSAIFLGLNVLKCSLFDALRLGVWQLLSLDVYGLIIGRKTFGLTYLMKDW